MQQTNATTGGSMTNAERLERCKAEVERRLKVCEAATPGPWTSYCDKRLSPSMDHPGMSSRVLVDRPNYDDTFVIRGGNPLGISRGNVVCSADSYSGESGSPDDLHNAHFIAASRNERPGELRIIAAMLAAVEPHLLSDVGPFESGDQCWYTGKNWGDPLDWCGCAAFPVEVSATEDPSGNEGYLVHWASPNYQAPQRTWAKRSELALRTNGAIPDAADRALHNNATALLDSIYSGLFGEAK